MEELNFKDSLECLINRHSIENASGTPDYMLAEYLSDCLDIYAKIVKQRDKWYGFKTYSNENALPANTEEPKILKRGIYNEKCYFRNYYRS